MSVAIAVPLLLLAAAPPVAADPPFVPNALVSGPTGIGDAAWGGGRLLTVATLPNGTFYVAWQDRRNSPDMDIYFAASYDGAQTFTPAVNVSDDAGQRFEVSPAMAVDAHGTIYVVMGALGVYFAKSVDGGRTFSPNVRIDDMVVGGRPDIAVTPSGRLLVVYEGDHGPGEPDIYLTESADGGRTWGDGVVNRNDVRVDDGPAGTVQSTPRLALDAQGTPNVVWIDDRWNSSAIHFARSPDGGSMFGPSVRVNDDPPGWNSNSFPDVAVDASGAIQVVWRACCATRNGGYYAASRDGGLTFGDGIANDNDVRITDQVSGAGEYPAILVDPTGYLHVAYDASWDIFYTNSTDGGSSWGADSRVTDDASPFASQIWPELAADSCGNVQLAWFDERNGRDDIYASRLPRLSLDLSVYDPDVVPSPSGPVPVGTAIVVGATIHNYCTFKVTSAKVRFFDGDPAGGGMPIDGDRPLTGLDPLGGSAYAEVPWTASPPGLHRLCAFVDPDREIPEYDETNNVACASVVVEPPPELRPDYAPGDPQPAGTVLVGASHPATFSIRVTNQGNGSAYNVTALAFYNESDPATPFATYSVPPLGVGGASFAFNATWVAPAAPGSRRVVAEVDYLDELQEWNETDNSFTWNVTVVTGPVTSLRVGAPNCPSDATYVTSATPLDFDARDESGSGILRTSYRIDGGPPQDFVAPFTLGGEGEHRIEWFSEDNMGNVEALRNATLVVDNTPPTTSLAVGSPRFQGTDLYVTSATALHLVAVDGGLRPVGLLDTSFRIGSGPWSSYATPFTVSGPDGPVLVQHRAVDFLGNEEPMRTTALVLDDTPPETTMAPGEGPFSLDARFELSAQDNGSGVRGTEYRVDDGAWVAYAGPFSLPEGEHAVRFRSTDNVDNREPEQTRRIVIEGNWKPLVAAVFAFALVGVGLWSARRRPWNGSRGARAVLKAFAVVAMPFVAAEAVTGVVSLATGWLSIPPVVGPGTGVDLTVLVVGLLATVRHATRPTRAQP